MREATSGQDPNTSTGKNNPGQDGRDNEDIQEKNLEELKTELGVDSWGDVGPEQLLRLGEARALGDIDPETARNALGTIPHFKELVVETSEHLKATVSDANASNDRSQERVYATFERVQHRIDKELERDDLTPERRDHLLELMLKAADKSYEKDTENKRYLGDTMKTVAKWSAGAIAAVGAVAVAGGAVVAREVIQQRGSNGGQNRG
ncbi:hypothetical protein [Nesterenkonia alba]|uniref:hypothetical protein n=1 Tax=Nesterenkonia alba TaxID=515814 RepID=UPI0003B446FE|nr:hypothetical protein [Nesterenkonia alba]